MSNIYLPMEVVSRELISRSFLGTSLAHNGNNVYIFEHTFFDRNGWPDKGIYIGKNCFRTEVPASSEYYENMKNSGVNLWHLDEEGGIFNGITEEMWVSGLKRRFDASKLSSNDKILCWGNWQKKFYDNEKTSAKVLISGNPNFDIFQKKYSSFFEEYDLNQTKGKRDFILINSRFSDANSPFGINFAINNPSFSGRSKKVRLNQFITENKLLYLMAEMVIELAVQFPEESFIFRPHPAESLDIYQLLFSESSNIKVIREGPVDSWIRLSKALIHNGCSTALQAFIANKKVVSFVPKSIEQNINVPGLPNKIGFLANSMNQVISILNDENSLNDDTGEWQNTLSMLDSIKFITKLVASEGLNKKNDFNESYYTEKIKDSLNSLSKIIFNRELRKSYSDINSLNKIPEMVKIANKYYNSNVKCNKITKGCFQLKSN